VPVLVVGNVVAGGVGKTPVVIALVQHLQAQGWQVGVISRGYGRTDTQIRMIHEQSSAKEVGDEPLLIAKRCACPVAVGSDRVQVARALLAQHPQVQLIVSDDGLQHASLPRDIEICVFDERLTGNGWLLPAGPLRESWPRAHTAAWCLEVQTRDAPRESIPRPSNGDATQGASSRVDHPTAPLTILRHLSPIAHNAQGQTKPLTALSPAQALAGIAKPQQFFDQLRLSGVDLRHTWGLSDHDQMHTLPPIEDSLPLLCTEKDAVKLWQQHPSAWAVALSCTLPPEMTQWLDQALSAVTQSRTNPV
jgi:tetraacyldisaccharide 4'-kinase